MKKTLTLLFGATLLSVGAQELKHCGTTEAMKAEFDKNPQLYQEYLQREAQARIQDSIDFANGYQNATANQRSSAMPPVYTIPVVFHILHEYGSENISDAQVYDEMRILNEDFRKLNSDIVNVVPGFQSIASDCEIEFKLATIDPNGNCTNGIVRHYDPNTDWPNSSSAYAYTWPRNKYLNFYVVKTISSGAAGYTYLPGTTTANQDAIVILNSYVGSIGTGNPTLSRALTHEVGHWLNLQHVWGSTNQPGVSCGNDGVTDTPVTEGYYSQCPLTNCDICNPGTDENVQNYMEYSYCSNMFTAGQKTRMRTALTSSTASRNNLWTTANLAATGVSPVGSPCVPIADFKVSKDYVCTNTNVTYSDLSWNGQPTSWSWSFPGGTPSTSTDSIPVVQYASPGTYNATMTVSNAQGSSTPLTKTAVITVFSSTATYAGGWQESFETSAIPNADWTIDNPGGVTWTRTSNAAYTGTYSMYLQNTSNTGLSLDEAISTGIDISGMTSPTMTFKVAYAQKNANQIDNLKLFVSTNCGSTWTQKYNKSGSTLQTLGSGVYQSAAFTPTSTQWRTETISLTNVLGSTNLMWKFAFTCDTTTAGNNIYIDDINIVGAGVGIEDQELENNLNFYVAPNPSNGQTSVNFNLTAKNKVTLEVVDVLGRKVESLANATSYDAGEYKLNIGEKTSYSSGIYFINLTVGDKVFTRKMMVD